MLWYFIVTKDSAQLFQFGSESFIDNVADFLVDFHCKKHLLE
jgi:hypothetical protein